jgi:hypothetical protein
MGGGVLNLTAVGNMNIILNGNPQKNLFHTTYKTYENFGMQKFRLDFEGVRTLDLTQDSHYTFKVKRYADLLNDICLSITLPNIWSPIAPPYFNNCNDYNTDWTAYEFQWIKNIGTKIIREIELVSGRSTLFKSTGDCYTALIQRDYTLEKRKVFDEMTGNTNVFNDPANAHGRINTYPNAYYLNGLAIEPSIRGRQLLIPLNFWFNMNYKQAFPLCALQQNELEIKLTLRPIQELFTIRDIKDQENNYPRIKPNFNLSYQQYHTFIQEPPNAQLEYTDERTNTFTDIHLIANYTFLDEDLRAFYIKYTPPYLIREFHEFKITNVIGSQKVDLQSLGMVSSWMFYFQRSDVNLRNEWSNYTNWPYNFIPYNVTLANEDDAITNPFYNNTNVNNCDTLNASYPTQYITPTYNSDGTITRSFISGQYQRANQKDILINMAILFDGTYREDNFTSGIYQYVEQFNKSEGIGEPGLYSYNFCLETSPFKIQPTGAINLNKINDIKFELNTYQPVLDTNVQVAQICTPEGVIGINKPIWNLYEYTYDLFVFEERFNVLEFQSGNVGLKFARN